MIVTQLVSYEAVVENDRSYFRWKGEQMWSCHLGSGRVGSLSMKLTNDKVDSRAHSKAGRQDNKAGTFRAGKSSVHRDNLGQATRQAIHVTALTQDVGDLPPTLSGRSSARG